MAILQNYHLSIITSYRVQQLLLQINILVETLHALVSSYFESQDYLVTLVL